MQDDWDEIEKSARWAVQQEDPWLYLVSESHRTTNSWSFWTCAFDAAVERCNAPLADQIMRDRLKLHEDYSAQPWLTTDHARVLEQLDRIEEALSAIRSAIEDLPFDEELLQIELRLVAKLQLALG